MNTVILHTRCALSPQQKKVLALIAKGHNNKEICLALSISKYTFYKHIGSIIEKTGIRSRVLIGFYALAHGIVTQDDIKAAIQRDRNQ